MFYKKCRRCGKKMLKWRKSKFCSLDCKADNGRNRIACKKCGCRDGVLHWRKFYNLFEIKFQCDSCQHYFTLTKKEMKGLFSAALSEEVIERCFDALRVRGEFVGKLTLTSGL